ncbi:MAG: leucine-rich repeat protein [Eubacterium sp.]|nr:leucine-rich repeat protein [Eubacterium sp.]
MPEEVFLTPDGRINYIIEDSKAVIRSYSGDDEELIIPEELSDVPVRVIDKKAFMNARRLRRIVLPDNIKKISDWGFAYCKNLTEAELPRRTLSMGRSPFLGDTSLQKIRLRARVRYPDKGWLAMTDKEREDTAVLLAKAQSLKNADHLTDCKKAGTDDWFEKLDKKILEFIDEPDEDGHTELILCGEEDLDCTLESFISAKRKEKIRLSFLRLLHPSKISAGTEDYLKDYLVSHSVGCESTETWQLMKEEFGHLKAYYEYYVAAGCLNDDNFSETIVDLGDKQAEMKAYFLRQREGNKKEEEDFFDRFTL